MIGGADSRPCERRALRMLRINSSIDCRPAFALHYHHMCAYRDAVVEVNDVLIEQAEAAARNSAADGLRFIGSVKAKKVSWPSR